MHFPLIVSPSFADDISLLALYKATKLYPQRPSEVREHTQRLNEVREHPPTTDWKLKGHLMDGLEPEQRLSGIEGTTKWNQRECQEPEQRLSGNAMENIMECLEPERRLSGNEMAPYFRT